MSREREVQGHHKVAALLLSLDQETRCNLLARMTDDAVRLVASAMIELDPRLTEAGAVERLKEDLARSVQGARVVRPCREDALGELLVASLGRARGESLFAEILRRRKKDRPFHSIEALDPFDVGRVLREESNVVAALVLTHLPPATSAKVLEVFGEVQAVDVVRRMSMLEPLEPAVLDRIAQALFEKVSDAPLLVGVSDPTERLRRVAELLNQSRPEMEKSVFDAIAEEDMQLAQDLREFMFTWEDLASIDKRAMQKILGMVDTRTLSIALKGCSPAVQENVLGNLSARVKEMVAEERELAGAVPMSEVLQARDDIMRNVRAMIETSEFRPRRKGDELIA